MRNASPVSAASNRRSRGCVGDMVSRLYLAVGQATKNASRPSSFFRILSRFGLRRSFYSIGATSLVCCGFRLCTLLCRGAAGFGSAAITWQWAKLRKTPAGQAASSGYCRGSGCGGPFYSIGATSLVCCGFRLCTLLCRAGFGSAAIAAESGSGSSADVLADRPTSRCRDPPPPPSPPSSHLTPPSPYIPPISSHLTPPYPTTVTLVQRDEALAVKEQTARARDGVIETLKVVVYSE